MIYRHRWEEWKIEIPKKKKVKGEVPQHPPLQFDHQKFQLKTSFTYICTDPIVCGKDGLVFLTSNFFQQTTRRVRQDPQFPPRES